MHEALPPRPLERYLVYLTLLICINIGVVIFVHLFFTTFLTTLFFSSMIGQKQ